jgi:hypothetical protein
MLGARMIQKKWQVPNRYPLFTPTEVRLQVRIFPDSQEMSPAQARSVNGIDGSDGFAAC